MFLLTDTRKSELLFVITLLSLFVWSVIILDHHRKFNTYPKFLILGACSATATTIASSFLLLRRFRNFQHSKWLFLVHNVMFSFWLITLASWVISSETTLTQDSTKPKLKIAAIWTLVLAIVYASYSLKLFYRSLQTRTSSTSARMVEQIRKNSADKVIDLLDATKKIPQIPQIQGQGVSSDDEKNGLGELRELVSQMENNPNKSDADKQTLEFLKKQIDEFETPLEKVFTTAELGGYFDKQDKLFCAIHAVNNLFGEKKLTPDIMTEICKTFQEKERSQNCNPDDGNYSNSAIHQYLSALEEQNVIWYAESVGGGFKDNLPYFVSDIENSIGFLVLKGDKCGGHWTAWRKVRYNGNDYLVFIDSLNGKEEFPGYLISEKGLEKISTGKFKFPNGDHTGSIFWITEWGTRNKVREGVLYNAFVPPAQMDPEEAAKLLREKRERERR